MPNVVYTCAALVHGGQLIIPYAYADHVTSFATVALDEVLDVDRLLGMFVKAGYRGYISLEYEDTDPETGVPRLAAELLRGVRECSA